MHFSQGVPPLATFCFWLSIGLVFYVYAGYPILVWVLSRLFGRQRGPLSPAQSLPSLSVVIAAHNEEAVIAERMRNLMALDYPADALEIVIASDGSTDATCDIVRGFESARVRLLAFAENRGKAAVLNDAVKAATGDIVVLSDANTMMDPSAARLMARWFTDPQVGVVCGRLILTDAAGGLNVDGVYWKYETFLKVAEARLGALLGANGAIYAIRRSLFPTLPHKVAVDDFVIPLLARLHFGAGIAYEVEALAFEQTSADIGCEFDRRSRIGAGAFQSIPLLWRLSSPRQGWLSLAFVSHKLLRWLCPFFLIGAVLSNALLIPDPVYRYALAIQAALYALATAGHFSRRTGNVFRLVRLTTLFAAMNLALLAGFYRWASGRQGGAWTRTARTAPVAQ